MKPFKPVKLPLKELDYNPVIHLISEESAMPTKKSKVKDLVSRRELLQVGVIGAAGLTIGLPNIVYGMAKKPSEQKIRKRALRFAHLCDIHMCPHRGADEGLASMLKHSRGLDDPPGLYITGGDNILDSWESDEEYTRIQWELFSKVVKEHCDKPMRYCMGNHDVFGADKQKSRTTGNERLWGKKWFVEHLAVPGRYYSFDETGWRFIVLDSIKLAMREQKTIYIGELDPEQLDWLKGLLDNTPPEMPIVIVSHIPIVSVCGYENLKPGENLAISISGASVHHDGPALIELFNKYPNVKLCLGGHLHRLDRIEYCGTTYICDGAVCGAWWGGDHEGCDEGYGVIDLYDDGTFDHQYVAYGWEPRD